MAQERLYIIDTDGERITAAAVLADSVEQNDKRYFRWACAHWRTKTLIVLQPGDGRSGRGVPA